MTLPLVYWVQYRDMLFFPSFLYYVTGTGCISAMLYFALYVMPDSLKRLNGKKKPAKQILLLPPPAKSVEENNTSEEHHTAEPTIYNKVEEVPPVLSPSVPDTISKANQKETMMYKKFYYTYVEKYVRKYLSDENAQIVLEDIYLAIDNRALDLIVDGHKTRLPFEVKATSKFNSLNTEDIYHIGFVVKFFLKKSNVFGATFIKEVFPYQLRDVEFSTVTTKLTSSESKNPSIPIPKVCWGDNRSISKKFSGHITEELIKQI
jgi:hypothetical protein